MAMEEPLILVANPGSASRKYALFRGETCLAHVLCEYDDDGRVVCSLWHDNQHRAIAVDFHDVAEAGSHIGIILQKAGILNRLSEITGLGLRIVAPSGFFLQDHLLDDTVRERLQALQGRAPLHITATLGELERLQQQFPHLPIAGISDSAFHASKPDYAWNYGLPLDIADELELKRFGYHGLSLASAVEQLQAANKLPLKIIIAHLGSGASVTAVHAGKSMDATMGYSPLEGLMMGTRSGTIDIAAALVLKDKLGLDDQQLDAYLNTKCGLLGLGGAADIRVLLQREAAGDHQASLALATYVHAIQKAIGQMAAALGGVDALVLTGAVGERSVQIRERVTRNLHYLDIALDAEANQTCVHPEKVTIISKPAQSKPIFVVPAQEAAQIARRAAALLV